MSMSRNKDVGHLHKKGFNDFDVKLHHWLVFHLSLSPEFAVSPCNHRNESLNLPKLFHKSYRWYRRPY